MSSSFIMLVKKDVHDEIVAGMNEEDRKIIKALFTSKIMKNTEVLGIPVIEIGIFIDDSGGGTWDDFRLPGTPENMGPIWDAYVLLNTYKKAARQHKDVSACWSSTIGDSDEN